MEEGREIVLCEWCLFDQRNGNLPGVQRGKDQWLQPYPAPVQGRLWEAEWGSHESLQSPSMMSLLWSPQPTLFTSRSSVILKLLPFKHHPGLGCRTPPPPRPPAAQQTIGRTWMMVDGKQFIQHPSQAAHFHIGSLGWGWGVVDTMVPNLFKTKNSFHCLSFSSVLPLALKSSVYQTNHIY